MLGKVEAYLAFRARFLEVIDQRYYSLEWLDQQVLTGQVKVFACEEAALITECKLYPTGARDVHALIAAGDLEKIITELVPQAEEWGRKNGCVAALCESRAGWAKALKPYGYEAHQMTVRKEL